MKKFIAKELQEELSKQSKILYIFDYDGTLTPIVERRNEAILTAEQVEQINELHRRSNSAVAVVSGRGLSNLQDLISRAPVKLDESILIIGSHGAEISGQEVELDLKEQLSAIRSGLETEFKNLDIEDKKISVAVHYREHNQAEQLVQDLHNFAQKFSDQFRVQDGLKVLEFVPKEINKGLAINFLQASYPDHYLVYFGDDYTDCFAFDRVNELGGLSVQIDGRIESNAQIKIASVDSLYANLI